MIDLSNNLTYESDHNEVGVAGLQLLENTNGFFSYLCKAIIFPTFKTYKVFTLLQENVRVNTVPQPLIRALSEGYIKIYQLAYKISIIFPK